MVFPKSIIDPIRKGYMFCLLPILSATVFLSLATAQTQSLELCSAQICISASIFSEDTSTIEFSLFSKIPVGWVGLGMGGNSVSMNGNDLAICWPNMTGSGAVISQRSARNNGQPSVLTETVAFQVQQNKSGLTPSSFDFVCTYSRPLSLSTSPIAPTATSINVIYAIGLQAVSGSSNPQQASIAQHAFTGNGVLNIQRRQGASSDPNNTITEPLGGSLNSGSAQSELAKMLKDENIYNTLVQVHDRVFG
ncbi:hypothetical protein EMPS_04878 [Entomortierella parvispora]|uniref:DOMON domain-containing protein n=1 Tax=Entomortierella parvispora TaxID=205924 RepID=A0A9P3LW75_9FUNG|nr:hypothetical protein EMPS_04878 [Entomortierella parvispora]